MGDPPTAVVQQRAALVRRRGVRVRLERLGDLADAQAVGFRGLDDPWDDID